MYTPAVLDGLFSAPIDVVCRLEGQPSRPCLCPYFSGSRLIHPLDPYVGILPACGGVGPPDHFPFASGVGQAVTGRELHRLDREQFGTDIRI